MLDLVFQSLQCTIPCLCYNTVLGSPQFIILHFITEWLFAYPCQRSHDGPSDRHRYRGACLCRARMDNIQRVWLESVQVPWS